MQLKKKEQFLFFFKNKKRQSYLKERNCDPWNYDFLFILEKKEEFLFFLNWHFHALLSRNDSKRYKITRIINKIYNYLNFFTIYQEIFRYFHKI